MLLFLPRPERPDTAPFRSYVAIGEKRAQARLAPTSCYSCSSHCWGIRGLRRLPAVTLP